MATAQLAKTLAKEVMALGKFSVQTKRSFMNPNTERIAKAIGRRLSIGPVDQSYHDFENGASPIWPPAEHSFKHSGAEWRAKKEVKLDVEKSDSGVALKPAYQGYRPVGQVHEVSLSRQVPVMGRRVKVSAVVAKRRVLGFSFGTKVVEPGRVELVPDPKGKEVIGHEQVTVPFPFQLMHATYKGPAGAYLFEYKFPAYNPTEQRKFDHLEYVLVPKPLGDRIIGHVRKGELDLEELFKRVFPHWHPEVYEK